MHANGIHLLWGDLLRQSHAVLRRRRVRASLVLGIFSPKGRWGATHRVELHSQCPPRGLLAGIDCHRSHLLSARQHQTLSRCCSTEDCADEPAVKNVVLLVIASTFGCFVLSVILYTMSPWYTGGGGGGYSSSRRSGYRPIDSRPGRRGGGGGHRYAREQNEGGGDVT